MAGNKWTSTGGETANPWTGLPGYFLGSRGPSEFGSGSTAEQVAASYDGTGKTVLITGASAGLGKEAARVLAARGCHVIMPVRDLAKGQAAAAQIKAAQPDAKLDVLSMDLSSLASVKDFAHNYIKSGRPLHTLICNAGIMALPEFSRSAEGHELQFATNHLGHFLLVKLLLPLLLDTAKTSGTEGRVVVLSSAAHFYSYKGGIMFDQLDDASVYSAWAAYGQSKLANVLFARQLAERLQGEPVAVAVCHPGGINTELGRNIKAGFVGKLLMTVLFRPFMKNIPQGTATEVYCATAPAIKSGEYYADCNLAPSHPLAHDKALAQQLWEVSEKLVQGFC